VYAGIEYRYVNRSEAAWTKEVQGFVEKPVFWVISPYQFFLLLPLFVIAGFTTSVGAWAGNTFVIAIVEDIAYFGWAKRRVVKGEWTTQLFGSLRVAGFVVPVWWLLDSLVVAAFYLLAF